MKKKKQGRDKQFKIQGFYEPPQHITEDGFDEGFFGPGGGMGMGMGMGMGPPPGSGYGPVDSVYFPMGESLLYRHEWRQHVYLGKFIEHLSQKDCDGVSHFEEIRNAINEGTYLNTTEALKNKCDEKKECDDQNKIKCIKISTYLDCNNVHDLSNYDTDLFEECPDLDEEQDHREIMVLKEYEKARSSDQIDDIFAEAADFVPLFESLKYFDGHSHPKTYQLTQTLVLIGFTISMYYKELYKRKRPSVVDPSLNPIIKVPTFKALPSGHATQAHLLKHMLSAYTPCSDFMKKELREAAEDVSRNREIGGVHYYADTVAGKILAEKLWEKFDTMLSTINVNDPDCPINENIREKIEQEWRDE